MITATLQDLQRIATETGYSAKILERVIRLLEVLDEIARDEDLSERLALKGGTALNAFHLGLNRLSVDIDLNFLGPLDQEAMEAERPEVETALNEILASLGQTVRRQPAAQAGGKWITRFNSLLGGSSALEIDIGYVARQPLFGVNRMQSARFGELSASNVLVVDIHEVIAGKLSALFERDSSRDVFDARSVLSIEGLDWKNIKAAFLAFGAGARFDLRTVSVDTIKCDPLDLHRRLALCLPEGYFQDESATATWIEETVELCRERLAFLLEWSDAEREFLDGILDRGEVNADLLDVSPEVGTRIAAMPTLAWKCRKVRAPESLQP